MHRFTAPGDQENMNRLLILAFIFLTALSACNKSKPSKLDYSFNFKTGNEGWQAFFSDYPVGAETAFELESDVTNLPSPLDNSIRALMITGNNHSDDLLSFIYRKFDGLEPDKTYEVTFDVQLASNAPTNSIGIGGSPDLAFGVGGMATAPVNTPDSDNWYRPNFTSALQSKESNDVLHVAGTIGVGDDASDFVLVNRNNNTSPVMITANNKGELWLMMGTDSGFEGTTTLYYTSIKIKLH